MRIKIIGCVVALGVFTLLIPVGGIAQDTSRSLVVSRQAKLGDAVINPGKYTIVFDDNKDGEASLLKEGREVHKVSYKLTNLSKEAEENVVVFGASTDGSLEIRKVELKGLKTALEF
jgi:hypothetical protein